MEITTRTSDNIQILEMKGRLDLAGAEVAGKVFMDILGENPPAPPLPGLFPLRLLLDFKEVSYISSGGLRILVSALKKVTEAKGKMALVNMNVAVEEVFQFAGLDTVFAIYPGLQEGLKALRG